MIDEIKIILEGIDKTETESEKGWWSTSKGAEFGRKILMLIEKVIESQVQFKITDFGIIYALYGDRLYLSIDNGTTWRKINLPEFEEDK